MNVKRGRLIYARNESFEASVGSKGVEREELSTNARVLDLKSDWFLARYYVLIGYYTWNKCWT